MTESVNPDGNVAAVCATAACVSVVLPLMNGPGLLGPPPPEFAPRDPGKAPTMTAAASAATARIPCRDRFDTALALLPLEVPRLVIPVALVAVKRPGPPNRASERPAAEGPPVRRARSEP